MVEWRWKMTLGDDPLSHRYPSFQHFSYTINGFNFVSRTVYWLAPREILQFCVCVCLSYHHSLYSKKNPKWFPLWFSTTPPDSKTWWLIPHKVQVFLYKHETMFLFFFGGSRTSGKGWRPIRGKTQGIRIHRVIYMNKPNKGRIDISYV